MACDADAPLQEADLERLAVVAFLLGEDAASDVAWTRAYRAHVRAGTVPAAVRCAFWLAFRLLNSGDLTSASGWIARIERLLGTTPDGAPEHGYLAYLTGLLAVFSGDLAGAEIDLGRSGHIAERSVEADLSTLVRVSLGRVLIFGGNVPGGVRLLDEAMLAVASGETSPLAIGDSYCTAIDACRDLFDVHRATKWTALFGRWCDTQPDLVPYAGVCLVHRAELLQLKGAWAEAMAQATVARARLSSPVVQLPLGAAIYQEGELHRLRGNFDEAQDCYRKASNHGRDPQPGLALLRLARGERDKAAHGIARALDESDDQVSRPEVLAAYVEVMLAVGDVAAAGVACAELAEFARSLGSPMLTAVSDRATGAVELAEGNARGALAPLRRASSAFRNLEAVYDVARTGILIGGARRALDDTEGAGLEIEASRAIFESLGAVADLRALAGETLGQGAGGSMLLTAREAQVLRLVARGSTNRAIGTELGVSERTIDRHVSNIFAKLGVSSRAAATASGYESGLF
ncbi:LuxR C-terminal-related transcriptional regulator [soil metagenome]